MGKGGAQKPASKPRQVQELGRVCLGRKLYFFAFVFSLFLFSFLIKAVTLSHLSIFKNVSLPNLYRACSGQHWDAFPAQLPAAAWQVGWWVSEQGKVQQGVPFGKRQIATRLRVLQGGGRKCFLCRKSCSLSGQIIVCERLLYWVAFSFSHGTSKQWKTNITAFLVHFCEVWNIWKVSEWEKPLFTYSSFLHSLSGVDAKQTKTLKLYEHNIISNKE